MKLKQKYKQWADYFFPGNPVLSAGIVLSAMQKAKKETGYPEGGLNIAPEAINDGYCDWVAEEAVQKLSGAEYQSIDDYPSERENYIFDGVNGHAWFKYKKKYYDAEVPNGVSDWRELPFFLNRIKQKVKSMKLFEAEEDDFFINNFVTWVDTNALYPGDENDVAYYMKMYCKRKSLPFEKSYIKKTISELKLRGMFVEDGNLVKDELNESIIQKILFESEELKYTIFCDMDQVLCDFIKGYHKLTGEDLSLHKTFKKIDNWEDVDAHPSFWSDLEWMPDGKALWNYISKYRPNILSSPSHSNTAEGQKRHWLKQLKNINKIYFAQSHDKYKYATENSILIDDHHDNINQWRAAGGIGILHTSTRNTIKELNKLGL